jgi:inosine-uridine nucleoside N-ribohydrolase
VSARAIHIDTDPGLDDLLALALALASPELEVRGVTTVAGNASLAAVTDNAARFLALCGAPVPLGRGAPRPLSLEPVTAEQIHGPDGRQGIPLPEVAESAGAESGTEDPGVASARDVLRQSLEAGVECVVALGPLTNLAELVLERPTLLDGAEVVWMGGTLGRGNVTPLAEFNSYADPEAVGVLLASDVALRVIGLDVTQSVVVRPPDLEAEPFGCDPVGRFLERTLRALMEAERPLLGEPIATLHDPSAVMAAIFPDLFRYEELNLQVRVEAGRERGRLLARPDGARETGGHPVLYATEVRASEIVRLFLDRLASLEDSKGAEA